MKKRRARRNDRNQFRCETALPPAAVMQRIQALESMTKTIGFRYRESYQVAQGQLDDTIYFELLMMTQYEWTPPFPSRVVNGQIREIGPARTLVEGEVVTPPRVRAIGIALIVIVGAAAILLYLTGNMPASEFAKIVAVVIVGVILIRVFSGGRQGRHPIIYTIERRLQSRAEAPRSTGRHLPDQADELSDDSDAPALIRKRQERG
jgi:hypothetical protein